MRRLLLLAALTTAAFPLFTAPAQASINCGPYLIFEDAGPPFCTVKCALTLDLHDPCWIQD